MIHVQIEQLELVQVPVWVEFGQARQFRIAVAPTPDL